MLISSKKTNIGYIANAGVCISNKNKKVLIDGIHVAFVKPYFPVDEGTLKDIMLGKDDFNQIDVLAFTHHHLEHFDAYAVCETLKVNRYTQLIGTNTILRLIQESANFDPIIMPQINSFEIPPNQSMFIKIKGIPFEVISMKHDGAKYQNVENFCYNFRLANKSYLHVGDASPNVVEFEKAGLFEKNIDVLMVPFPFVGLSQGREIIDRINPVKLIVLHLPDKRYDTNNWLNNTYRAYKKYKKMFPDTEFLTTPGEYLSIKE